MEIPGYRIERLIAEGSTASVYLAVQQSLGRQVALKVLKQFDNPEQSTRFLTEGQIVAALNHRNIITIYDIGCVGSHHYIAMEYLEGGSLTDRIRQGMSLAAALELLEGIAGCLDFVHRKGVVHRDVKPDNILFHADGTPKLTDFGIAKQYSQDQDLTMDGRAFGSPYYLSPEQAQGKVLDGRSDIYALGIVFYEMLTGQKPYAEESHVQTILAHMSQPVPVLPAPYAAYQDLLELMVAKAPEDRFGSAAELVGYVRGLGVALNSEPNVLAMVGERTGRWWKYLRRAAVTSYRYAVARPKLALGLASAVAVALGVAMLPSGDQAAVQTLAKVDAKPKRVQEPAPAKAAAPVAAREGSATPKAPPLPAAPAESPPQAVAAVAEPEPSPGVADRSDMVPPDAIRLQPLTVQNDPVTAPTAAADGPATAAAAVETLPQQVASAPVDVAAPEAAADASRQAELARWLQAAEQALQAYRLTTPPEDSAYFYYQQVMELEPEHQAAREGMALIADRYLALAHRQLNRGNSNGARLYVVRGLGVQPAHAPLLRLKAELARPQPSGATPRLAKTSAPAPGVAAVEDSQEPKSEGKFVQGWKNFWNTIIPR